MVIDVETAKSNYNENKLKNLELQHKTILYLTNLIENRELESSNHEISISSYVELIAKKCLNDGVYADQINPAFIKKKNK